jgi:heme-degrading monooxygenase HmoA
MPVRPHLAAALALLLGGCTIATPFREASPAGPEAGGEVIVALTEATLGPDRAARTAFWDGVRAVEQSLPDQRGLVGYALRRELLGSRAWTMTVWESEEDLARFVRSQAHGAAIRTGAPALAGQRFASVTRPRAAGPMPWAEALDVLERKGQGYR